MTHLLIVLAVTCGTGIDILAKSQPDGRVIKRGCCQKGSDATVRPVPTADPVAAVKPCCAKQATTGHIAAAPIANNAGLSHPAIGPPANDTRERVNTSCPVCDRRLADESETVYHNGFRVGVCPGICHATFGKTSAIEKDAFIARLAKPISSRCAVTGCQCPKGSHPATFNGSVVSLCCDTCRNYWYDSDHATRAGWVRKNIHVFASAQRDGHKCRTPPSESNPAQAAAFDANIFAGAAARSIMNLADAGGSGESIPPGEGKPTCSGGIQARMVLLEVDGMASESDAGAVEDALGAMKGVFRTTVDRETKLVDILVDLSGPIDAERAAKFLSLAGYDAREASPEQYETETERLRRGGAIVQIADFGEIEER